MKNNDKKKLSTHIYFQVEDILYEKDNAADIKITIKRKEKIVKIRLNNNKSFCISYKKYCKKEILDDDKKWIRTLKKSIHKQLKKTSFKKLFIITLANNVNLRQLKKINEIKIDSRLSDNTYSCYANDQDIDIFVSANDSKVTFEENEYIEVPADEIEQIERINENIEDISENIGDALRSIKSRSRSKSIKEPHLTRIGDSNTNNNIVYPPNLYVFVIDSGIYEHPDLNINKELSRDFTNSDIGWSDNNGHGTHVAGTIGAKNSNTAVAPGVQLIAHKVLGENGRGSVGEVIESLGVIKKFKEDYPSSIIVVNMSLGMSTARNNALSYSYGSNGVATNPPIFSEIEKRIQNLIQMDVTFIIAAGNSTIDAYTVTPARIPQVIAVGAYVYSKNPNPICRGGYCGSKNNIAIFSNFGSSVSIMAPGVDIYSTWHGYINKTEMNNNNNVYGTLSGTSMAAPIVTGAVVNMIRAELNKTGTILTPSEIKQRLQNDSEESYNDINFNVSRNEKIVMTNNVRSLCWTPPSSFTQTECNTWWFTPNNLQKTRPYSLYVGSYKKNGVSISNYQ